MKYLSKLTLVAALLAAMAFVSGNSDTMAQGKQDSYTSGVQFQNLESEEATLQLTAYNPDGTEDGSGQYTVAADGSITLFPLADVSTGFSGSIVLSSDRNGAAIANVFAADFSAGGSYVGRSQGATEVQLPLLFRGNAGFDTWFSVQNAGSAPASITIDYSDGAADRTATIPVGAAQTFFQVEETDHTDPVFAATITSDQPIVAAVIQESEDIIFAYTGFTGGTPNPLMPLINFNAGYITGAQIQNAGDTATEVTVAYTPVPGRGTACTETRTIAPGASETFALSAFAADQSGTTTTCDGGAEFVGSAQIQTNSADQPLVAIVNQLLVGVNGEAYGSFSADEATNSVVMPLILDRVGAQNFFTGFNVQNVGDVATPVTCTFTDASYTVNVTLQPGEALNDLQNNNIAPDYAGSGTCTASASGAKLVGVVNELGAPDADNLLVYEASAK